jgi:putative hydrolase of the HAD superfamily
MKPKILLFDCMETLIDMRQLPAQREYALWAYEESGYEKLWDGFEDFLRLYQRASAALESSLPPYKEYELKERFGQILRETTYSGEKSMVCDALGHSYWRRYSSECFISASNKEVLELLAGEYPLAVVSNFKVRGGVEELLDSLGVGHLFQFVVNSAEFGWRKPHSSIYLHALERAGVEAGAALFIGDDYIGDFEGPQSLGIPTILYDPKNRYPEAGPRVKSLTALPGMLMPIQPEGL